MASLANPRCRSCCKKGDRCDRCVSCRPIYLCVHGLVTPHTGTGTGTSEITGTGTSIAVCCSSFDQRIPSAGCGWSGTVGCTNAMIDIAVEIITTGTGTGTGTVGHCTTKVSSVALGKELYFAGSLPDMSFDGKDSYGTYYEITINRATLVENPLYESQCPVCACAGCLPSSLCVRASLNYRSCTTVGSGIGTWNCNGWTVPAIRVGLTDIHVTIELETDGTCGAKVRVTSSTGTGTGTGTGVSINQVEHILFENLTESPENPGGYECTEYGSGGTLHRGVAPYDKYDTHSIIDQSYTLVDTNGLTVGTLKIQDHSCGSPCEATQFSYCSGHCPTFEPVPQICQHRPDLHVELIAPEAPLWDGTTWVITQDTPSFSQTCPTYSSIVTANCQITGLPGPNLDGRVILADCPPPTPGNTYAREVEILCFVMWYSARDGCGDLDVDMSRYRLTLTVQTRGACNDGGIAKSVTATLTPSDWSCPSGWIDFTWSLSNMTSECTCYPDTVGDVTFRISV